MNDKPEADTSTWQHTTLTRDIYVLAGFEPAVPASEQLQTHALDRAATGVGILEAINIFIYTVLSSVNFM